MLETEDDNDIFSGNSGGDTGEAPEIKMLTAGEPRGRLVTVWRRQEAVGSGEEPKPTPGFTHKEPKAPEVK